MTNMHWPACGGPAFWKRLAACAVVVLLACNAPASGSPLTERARQKREAEAERAELQQKLDALKRAIDQTETAKGHAADALAQSEAAISTANRELRELADEQRQAKNRLDKLSKEQHRLSRLAEAQRRQLGQLLRQQYISGNEDRMRLLLSGDNPNRINRDLQYMGYASQAQARLITGLRANLQSVDTVKSGAQQAQEELDEIAKEQHQQKAQLEREKARRAVLLSQLSDKLAAQRRQAGHIERDEQRLASLVVRLSKLIEEQQRIAGAQKEKQRQEAARNTRGAVPAARLPDAIDDDEPPAQVAGRNHPSPETGGRAVARSRPFRTLRGQLRPPVLGELAARYGSKRGDAPAWKGWFIKAAEGAEVKAVAGGQVVFAEWLRGFGNLIIVDHGDQYLTIYGNNQALLKRAGDAIRMGEVIASAGNSGGNEQSGLYFEMRHEGRAFDPLQWVTFR